jgi:hypothetical protein
VVGGRAIVFHPLGLQHLRNLVKTVTQWFAPEVVSNLVSNYLICLVYGALFAVVIGTIVSALRSERRTTEMRFRLNLLLAEICLVLDVVYILVLFLTISFVDALTPLDMRLLYPIYPVTTLLLISSLTFRRELFGRKSVIYCVLLVSCILMLGSNTARFFIVARDIRANGIGFQTAKFRFDDIMKYVRSLPFDTLLYSDNPYLIYYDTRRASYLIPKKFDFVSTLSNDEYENQMKSLAELGTRRNVVIIMFNTEWKEGPFPTLQEMTERWDFKPIFHSGRGPCVLGTGTGSFSW